MTVFADVYNKTAIPLTTAPSLKNDLEVKNTVDINSGSAINAIRNVNIKAESGTEVITESAKEYNIYTGENGTGSSDDRSRGQRNRAGEQFSQYRRHDKRRYP